MLDYDVLLTELDAGDRRWYGYDRDSYSLVVKTEFAAVLLCRNGILRIRLDLKEYTIGQNEMLIVVPGVVCERIDASPDCRITLVAYNNPQYIKEPSSRIALIPRRYLYRQPVLRLTDGQVDDFMSVYSAMRRRINSREYRFKKEVVYALLQVCYLDVSSLMQQTMAAIGDEVKDRGRQIYDAFMEELVASGGLHHDVAYFADKLCMTPKYLSRIVRNVSGRFAKDWIRDYVILQAKSMLDSGQYTIQQVSDKLNFSNQSFFGTYFKVTVGCSPRAYMAR
ncbi:MAG: helix-turn-helix domain-containing protein [Pseudoflavonifractor sp.]|nr:helix-turn-helix domain-containing protein [Pseudoflavonifractor sp.]